MPDINTILQWFKIDTSQFRTVPLKKYEKEMLLTKFSKDVILSRLRRNGTEDRLCNETRLIFEELQENLFYSTYIFYLNL